VVGAAAARAGSTDCGLNGGAVFVSPKFHASALPAAGWALAAPTLLCVQLVAPGAACQYDQDADAGGVFAHDVSGWPLILQMKVSG
jgi:hypothetical protein